MCMGGGETEEEGERECQTDSAHGTQAPRRLVYVVGNTVLFTKIIMLRCTNIHYSVLLSTVNGSSVASSVGLLGIRC